MDALRNRLFQTWFRFSRPMTLGVRALVENSDGQVLLVRHTYVSGLYFPGGGVEKAETCETALRRELEEEAGVRLEGRAHVLGIYSNHHVFKNDHVMFYRIPRDQWRNVKATSKGEISEIVWIDPLAPPEDATAGTKARLREIYASSVNDGYWVPATT